MSSALYRYRVDAVEGRDVVLTVRPTTAAGLCEVPLSRAFIAMLLAEHGGPLTLESARDYREWLPAHIDEHVTALQIERASGVFHEGSLRQDAKFYQIPLAHLQPELTLRATFADEARASCFAVSSSFAETVDAWDCWGADPKKVEEPRSPAYPPPFGVFDASEATVLAALSPLLPRWKTTPVLGLHRENDGVRLRVRVGSAYAPGKQSTAFRPGFEVVVTLEVPAFGELPRGEKRGETPGDGLVWGELRPGTGTVYWLRGYVGPDDVEPEPVTFADDVKLEEPAELFARVARALDGPDVAALLSPKGVLGLVEDIIAARPKKELPPNLTRLGAGAAPALPRWNWRWEPELFWKRVALHAALGSRDDARAALAQVQAKYKKPPKGLRALVESLT
jgi:hypothetical protein